MIELKEIIQKVGAESAAIMAPHLNEPYLFCKESINMPPEWVEIKNPIDNLTNNGRVYLSGQSYIAEHIDIEFVGHSISSILIVPIKKGKKPIATLELIISDTGKSLNKDAQKVAEDFASTLATEL